MSNLRLGVAAGQQREVVGSIDPQVGMLTSEGVVTKVTEKTVYFATGLGRRNLDGVTVRHSEARKYGYPNSTGSTRYRQRMVKVDGQMVAA